MQSQLVTCPAAGCGQPFLHLATEQAQSRACKECGLQYCCVRCRDRDKYGAHSPCILSHLNESNYNMLQPTYSRHIVLMLLEDPNNAVKAATLQRVGRIILWPAPQFTDFAKMARLAHWTQGGLVSSLAMCLVNLRDEVRGAVLGVPTTPPPPPPPVGTVTAPAAPGNCPSLPGALVASLEVLQRLLTPAKDGDKQQGGCAALCPAALSARLPGGGHHPGGWLEGPGHLCSGRDGGCQRHWRAANAAVAG
ncbi:hypothetical protein V8C86DRAFT_778678 [Haematococcus lacustris]